MGANILFIHDISDVVLYFNKNLHYLYQYGGRQWAETAGRLLFAVFASLFFYTRLYVYPIYVIWDACFNAPIRWEHPAAWYKIFLLFF